MKFTQFVFPNGRRRPEIIDMPEEIEKLAGELRDAGWSFEIECFPETQLVHMDCCDEFNCLSMQVCRNGPAVPVKVKQLVQEAHAAWVECGKPLAGQRSERV